MKLNEYLFFNNLKKSAFADQLGCSRWHLYSVLIGRRTFGPEICLKIEKLTKGMVTYDEARETGKEAHSKKK